MRFFNVLAVLVLPVSIAHAVAVDHQNGGLEARGCKYDSCDECHDRDNYCVYCNTGGGIGVSCAVCLAHCDPCC